MHASLLGVAFVLASVLDMGLVVCMQPEGLSSVHRVDLPINITGLKWDVQFYSNDADVELINYRAKCFFPSFF